MRKHSIIKVTAYCATAILTMVLPTGIIIDVEPILQELASKFR